VPAKPKAEAPSRRQEHKLRTERALQQAALQLFAKNGYDETTTDEIAEKAGVSPRTFFRYFPTKEQVLFVGQVGWFESFTKQFLAQPDDLSDVDALCQTLVDLAPEMARSRRALLAYERAVASSATLRGGVHDRLQADTAINAAAIAQRRGLPEPDEACSTLAQVSIVVHRRALTQWLLGPADAGLGDLIREHFAVLHDAFVAKART